MQGNGIACRVCAHIRGSPQQALSNIENPVLVQPEDMVVVCPLYQVLQVLSQKLVQLFEHGLRLLQNIQGVQGRASKTAAWRTRSAAFPISATREREQYLFGERPHARLAVVDQALSRRMVLSDALLALSSRAALVRYDKAGVFFVDYLKLAVSRC